MIGGFGTIDYVVVVLACLISVVCLAERPKALLLILPTLLTIDFFIPMGTQLTPYRIVPLMLGAWLLLTGRFGVSSKYNIPLALFIVWVALCMLYGLSYDDSGNRPILRLGYYLGIISIFVFSYHVIRNRNGLEAAIFGIWIAAIMHGVYSAYQVMAYNLGLPFRGIVYGDSGRGFVVPFGDTGIIRVNGFADEPKRLGYVLFCGIIVSLLYWSRAYAGAVPSPYWRIRSRLRVGTAIAVCCTMLAGAGLMTLAGSFYAAVAAALLLSVFVFTKYGLSAIVALGLAISLAASIAPDKLTEFSSTAIESMSSRADEVEKGLDAKTVYRQEFFAQDHLAQNWEDIVIGVGLIRYNTVLAEKYGPGAGFTADGRVMPINSQILEIAFDLGIPGLLVLYIGGTLLFVGVARVGPTGAALGFMMLFMLLQSAFVMNLHLLSFVAAMCAALISIYGRSGSTRRPSTTRASLGHPRFSGLSRHSPSRAVAGD